ARHGSIRSPLWVGGGVTFGPRKERNFSQKINKKMKRQALFGVLSQKLTDGEIFFVDEWDIPGGKTKTLAAMLATLCGALASNSQFAKTLPAILLVHGGNDQLIRAARNIPSVRALRADSLNVGDLLAHRYILFSLDAVALAGKTYAARTHDA
ncbi:MAG: 50S ribosomal protein L4, partial [Parcubacteria group bacterium]|nr:50S ribosomal protein L4 [Parcubacteria group bacterium]